MRSAQRILDSEDALNRLMNIGVEVINADQHLRWMAEWLSHDSSLIVIEGTQGYGLGLHAGYYPTCTSSDTRAIDFLAMAGINPWSPGLEHVTVWLVARVFPIRVAGASGPLKGETTWEELGLPEERTTVTHKVRRVGDWDSDLIRKAVVANGGATFEPSHAFLHGGYEVVVALTMVDQLIPGVKNQGVWGELAQDDNDKLSDLIRAVENDAGVAVGIVSTGPKSVLPIW
jgi:adenylosuccinate synthase